MPTLATGVYMLCLITSCACGWLLIRGYRRNRTRLLLWSAGCFVLLAANNLLVVIDLLVLPAVDLSYLRAGTLLLAVSVLLIGFIIEAT
jgi:hypothetical protein